MKKTIFFFVLGITSLSWSQEITDAEKKNEVKINSFNIIVFTLIDFSYEYLLNEESSIGTSLLLNLGGEGSRKFSITSYYRQYFSKGYAKGFFVEGFGMLNSTEDEIYNDKGSYLVTGIKNYTDFALGFSLGAKFLTKKGFVAEIYGGIGRNIFNANTLLGVVPRAGLDLGYRF